MRIKAIMLTAVMIIQLCVAPVTGLTESRTVYLNETFSSYATNDLPYDFTITGSENNRVVKENESNKVIKLDMTKGMSVIGVPVVETMDTMWFGMRYISSHKLQKGTLFNLIGAAGEENPSIKINEQGNSLSYGKPFKGLSINRWNDVAVKVNYGRGTYSVYVNGVCKIDDWKFENTPSSTIMVELEFGPVSGNSAGAYVYVDDIRIWSGDSYFPVSKSKGISNDEVDFTESEAEAELNIFSGNDFETTIDGLLVNPQSSDYNPNCRMELAKEENGNGYFMYELTTGKGGYFEINAKNSKGTTPVSVCFEFDIKVWENGGTPISFLDMRDQTMAWSQDFYGGSDGKIRAVNGNQEMPIIPGGDWVRMAFAYDLIEHNIDVYADGNKIYENIPMQNQNFGSPLYARIQMQTPDIPLKMGIDNMYVYESDKPVDDVAEKMSSSIVSTFAADESNAQQFLGKNTVFCVDSGAVYANKVRYDGVGKGIIINNRTMIPVRTLSEAFNLEVRWDADSKQVHIGEDVIVTVDDPNIKKGNSTIVSDVPATIIDGRVYLPLRVLAEKILGQNVLWDDSGLVFMNTGEVRVNKQNTSAFNMAYRYMMYDRMSGDELVELMTDAPRPRLLCDAEKIDVIKKWVQEDELAAEWFENAKNSAEGYIKQAPIPYNVSNGKIDRARAREEMIITLSLLYRVTGEEKYAEKAWQELENISTYPNWWPQHALETGALLIAASVGYDWLYDWLGEERREIIAEAIYTMGLCEVQKTFSTQSSGASYVRGSDNWVAVVNAGIIMGCMTIAHIEKYQPVVKDVFESSCMALEYIYNEFAPDGAWFEGPGYAIYTTHYLKYVLSSMQTAFGHCLNHDASPGLNRAPWFLIDLAGPLGWNFMHNSGSRPMASTVYAAEGQDGLWWGAHYNDPALTVAMISHMKQHSIPGGAQELIHTNPDHIDTPLANIPLDNKYGNVEYGVIRDGYGTGDEMWVSFHGGSNDFGHAHPDAGAFCFDALGERWATDIGADDYSLPEWGFGRSKYYVVRAEGHNVPVINPDADCGQEKTAVHSLITEFESCGDQGSYAILDLSVDYDKKDAEKVLRGFSIMDNRQSLTIRDEITLKKADREVYWFMHMEQGTEVDIQGDHAILTKNGKKMRVDFITNGKDAVLSEMKAEPLPTSPQGYVGTYDLTQYYKKLAIKTTASGELNITVRLTPMDGRTTDYTVDTTPLAQWKEKVIK